MIQNPSNQVINISDTITISCLIKGIPNPNITWLKDNQTVDASKYRTSSIGISTLSTLTFENVTIFDDGTYRCKGENTAGNIYTTEAILVVNCKYHKRVIKLFGFKVCIYGIKNINTKVNDKY